MLCAAPSPYSSTWNALPSFPWIAYLIPTYSLRSSVAARWKALAPLGDSSCAAPCHRAAHQNVKQAPALAQWLAGGPSHPLGGGPYCGHLVWTWLGPRLHKDGWGSIKSHQKDLKFPLFILWLSQKYLTSRKYMSCIIHISSCFSSGTSTSGLTWVLATARLMGPWKTSRRWAT